MWTSQQSRITCGRSPTHTVQPAGGHECDKKLRPVGIGASVGHRKLPTILVVSDFEVFIVECGAVDAFATSAVAIGEVAALDHEPGDDAMESGA